MLEVRVERERCRHVEVREVTLGRREVDIASFRDRDRVRQGLGPVPEHGAHLVRRLQVELVAVVAQPVLVADVLARPDAQKDVVRPVVSLFEIVDVVGAHEGQTEVPGDRLQPAVDGSLFLDALILHLEKEVSWPKNVPERGRRLARLAGLFDAQACGDLPLQAATQTDQSGRMLGQQLFVDPRLVIEPFRVARRHQLDQVVIPGQVLSEQDEVVVGVARRTAPGVAAPGCHVDLAPEDRFDATCPRLVVKDDAREEIAVLGDRQRGYTGLLCVVEQLADPAGAVQQRVLRVQMQMHELGGHGGRVLSEVRRQETSQLLEAPVRPPTFSCLLSPCFSHSHSIVEGGLLLMS